MKSSLTLSCSTNKEGCFHNGIISPLILQQQCSNSTFSDERVRPRHVAPEKRSFLFLPREPRLAGSLLATFSIKRNGRVNGRGGISNGSNGWDSAAIIKTRINWRWRSKARRKRARNHDLKRQVIGRVHFDFLSSITRLPNTILFPFLPSFPAQWNG